MEAHAFHACVQNRLLDDIMSSIKGREPFVYAVLKTHDVLLDIFGMHMLNAGGVLSSNVKIKVLLSEPRDVPTLPDLFECRVISKSHLCPAPYIIYGNKHVLVLREGSDDHKFVVFNSISQTESYKAHFQPLWDIAFPLTDIQTAHKRVVG